MSQSNKLSQQLVQHTEAVQATNVDPNGGAVELHSQKPLERADDAFSMVTRNPAPDASPSFEPTPSKSFTVTGYR